VLLGVGWGFFSQPNHLKGAFQWELYKSPHHLKVFTQGPSAYFQAKQLTLWAHFLHLYYLANLELFKDRSNGGSESIVSCSVFYHFIQSTLDLQLAPLGENISHACHVPLIWMINRDCGYLHARQHRWCMVRVVAPP
jgi:hypothetical protein